MYSSDRFSFERPSRSIGLFSGDRVTIERHKGGQGLAMPHGKRFCECCNQYKPRGTRRAVKGWPCDDCRASNRHMPARGAA